MIAAVVLGGELLEEVSLETAETLIVELLDLLRTEGLAGALLLRMTWSLALHARLGSLVAHLSGLWMRCLILWWRSSPSLGLKVLVREHFGSHLVKPSVIVGILLL